MARCPNIKHPDWIALKDKYGLNYALDLYDRNGQDIPTLEQVEKLLNKFKFQQNTESLNNKLESFLNDLNFEIKTIDNLKEVTGFNSESATDLLYKMILINNKSDYTDSLAKETAYVTYSLLGKKSKIRTDLIRSIKQISNYNKIFQKYKHNSPNLNDYKINELIVIDYLSDAIKNEYEIPSDSYINRKPEYWQIKGNTKLEKQIKYYLSKIKQFIEKIFNVNVLTYVKYNDLIKDIANDVLIKNFSKFGKELDENQQLTNYERTLSKDKKATEIIETFIKEGLLLTGSLSLRKQGTLYRSEKESLHDIDFTVPFSLIKKDVLLLQAQRDQEIDSILNKYESSDKGTILLVDNITKKYSILIDSIVENSEWFKNIKQKYPSLKKIRSFGGSKNDTFVWTGIIDDTYMIDFFLSENNIFNTQNINYFQDWQSIFRAKLKMGRLKDLKDFINYIPFSQTSREPFREKGLRHFYFKSIKKEKSKNDPLFNEALMSTDSELSNFIISSLSRNYPSIQLFKDKKSFQEFVNKNGGDMKKVDIDAIGNAFMNSIYIDLENAVQSTYFHENAHIYWDALPENNPVKTQLRELFNDESISNEEIDESIIRNIGIAGVSLAELELRGNKIQKFESLLTRFWAQVKNFLGIASKKDLVNIISNDVWNNKEKFDDKSFINHAVRNMRMNPFNIEQDDITHAFKYGDKNFTSVTRATNMLSTFNPNEAANIKFQKLVREKEKFAKDEDLDPPQFTYEIRERYIRMLKNRWRMQAEIGTGLHLIAQSTVNNIPLNEVKEMYVNEERGNKVKDYFTEEVLVKSHTKMTNFINNKINEGWKINSEVIVASLKYKMAGISDIVMEKDNKFAVLDFKSFFEEDKADKKSGRFLKFPLETIHDTKENKQQLQVDMYANMVEEQENKDVAFTSIVPFIYEIENGKVKSFSIDPVKTTNRKSRKAQTKDKYRANANEAMKYVENVQDIQESITIKDEDINKIAQETKIDPEILHEQNEAVKILSGLLGPLNEIQKESIERFLSTGIDYITDRLINGLGYDHKDIFGTDKEGGMTAKEFLEREAMNLPSDKELLDISTEDIKDFENRIIKNRVVKLNVSDFNSKNVRDAFKKYVYERNVIDEIYEEIGDVKGLRDMQENKLNSTYKKIINFVSPEAVQLKNFIEDLRVARILTERIKREVKEEYHGEKFATIFLSRLIKNPDSLFSGFKNYNWLSKHFKNIRLIDKDHVLVQLLAAEMMGEHRKTIKETEAIRDTLENLYKNKKKNGKKIPKKDRKQLVNDDFQDIIYTDENTGIKYFQTPSEAREIIEKKYGEDDIRAKNMANYLYHLTNELIKHDNRLKSISKRRQPNIMVPELQATWSEVLASLNTKNKIFVNKVNSLFSFKKYDNDIVNYKGEEKRLVDWKHEIYQELENKNAENESIYEEIRKITFIDRIAKNNSKKFKSLKNKRIFIKGKQTGRTILKTKNYNASIQEYLASIIEASMMEKTVPLAEFTQKQYRESGATDMESFLEAEISQKIFKNVEDLMKQGFTGKTVQFLIGWTAKRMLGIGILTNLMNRAHGILANILMHPRTMAKSYQRRFTNFGAKRNIVAKALGFEYKQLAGIMQSSNIGTILQDVTFSEYKKFWGKVNEIGFKPLEWTEIVNQGELLRGIITEKEINAYNKNGNPFIIYEGKTIDPDTDRSKFSRKKQIEFDKALKYGKEHSDVLTEERQNEIANILNEVHGYFGFNKSQWSYYTLGRLIGMFTLSWVQSNYNFMYQPVQTDSLGRVRKGVLNSVGLASRAAAYNVLMSSSMRSKYSDKINEIYMGGSGFNTFKEAEIKLYELDRFADPKAYIKKEIIGENDRYFIPGLTADLTEFENIIQKRRLASTNPDARIKIKEDLPFYDLQNMLRFANLLVVTFSIWYLRTMGDDKDKDIVHGEEFELGGEKRRGKAINLEELSKSDRFKHFFLKFLTGKLDMINEDVWLIANPEFYGKYFEAPPAVSTVKQSWVTVKHFWQYLVNDKEGFNMTPSNSQAYLEPKYINDMISLIPYFAQPYRVYKSTHRAINDSAYKEGLIKRADDNFEGYRKEALSNARASFTFAGDSQKDIAEKMSELEKIFKDNAKELKKMYIDIETLNDLTKSKYYNQSEFKRFYDYVEASKEFEEETEIERRKLREISKKDVDELYEQYKKEFE